jgi:hypothetical protein
MRPGNLKGASDPRTLGGSASMAQPFPEKAKRIGYQGMMPCAWNETHTKFGLDSDVKV